MKVKICIFITLTVLVKTAVGQFSTKWKIGEEQIVNGNTILHLEGENRDGGVCVSYQTLDQLKDYLFKRAEKEMWTKEKKNDMVYVYDSIAKGGRIALYVERSTINQANANNFTIIIKDANERELYRRELERKIPDTPSESSSEYWTNFTSILVPVEIGSFFIYVIERFGEERFKFQVRK